MGEHTHILGPDKEPNPVFLYLHIHICILDEIEAEFQQRAGREK